MPPGGKTGLDIDDVKETGAPEDLQETPVANCEPHSKHESQSVPRSLGLCGVDPLDDPNADFFLTRMTTIWILI